MILVPLGVIFAGYQLTWYGFANLKGPGMGFLDLLLPSRAAKAAGIVAGWPRNQAPGTGVTPSGTTPGTNTNRNPNPGTRPSQGAF